MFKTLLAFGLMAATALASDSTIYVALYNGPVSISQLSVETGKTITSFPTIPGADAMAISPNGQQAYVLSPKSREWNPNGNNTIGIVNLQKQKLESTLYLTLTPWCMVFDPSGTYGYVFATDSTSHVNLIVIDTATAEVIAQQRYADTWEGNPFGQAAISPNGEFLYFPTSMAIDVISTSSLTQVATISTPEDDTDAGIAASSDYIVVNAGETVNVYSAQNYGLVSSLPASPISNFATTEDGETLYFVGHIQAAQGSYTFASVNLKTLQLTQSPNFPENGGPIAISPTGAVGIVGNALVNLSTNSVAQTLTPLSYPAAAKFSPSGNSVYVLNSFSSTIAVVDQAEGAVTATIPVGDAPIWIAPTDQKQQLVVTNAGSYNLVFLNVPSGMSAGNEQIPYSIDPDQVLMSGEASANGLVFISSSEGFGYYSPVTGQFVSVLTQSGGTYTIVNFAQVNPSKTRILVDVEYLNCPDCSKVKPTQADPSGTLFVYDAISGAVTGSVAISPNGGMAFSPAGKIAYINTFSGNSYTPSISLFDMHAGKVVSAWPLPGTGTLWSMDVSPDGSKLYALDSEYEVIRAFDTVTGKQTTTFPVSATAKWMTLTPDGTQLYVIDSVLTTASIINTSTGGANSIELGSPGTFAIALP